jgi:hypothetical protein
MNTRRLFLIILTALFPLSVWARTIQVPGDAATVQAGLDSLHDYDTLSIAAGVYSEALLAPALHFCMTGPLDSTVAAIIDPGYLPGWDTLSCMILPYGSHPVIQHITFRNGPRIYLRDGGVGGILSYSLDPVLKHVVMDSVNRGFQQEMWDSSVVLQISNCQFRDVISMAIAALRAQVFVSDCEFSCNPAQEGPGEAGITCGPNSRIQRCRFSSGPVLSDNCIGLIGGGGLVEDCIFGPLSNCREPVIVFGRPFNVTIRRNLFVDCTMRYAPGLLSIHYPDTVAAQISDNTFMNIRRGGECLTLSLIEISYLNWPGNTGHWAVFSNNDFIRCTAGQRAHVAHLNSPIEFYRNRFVECRDNSSIPMIRIHNGHLLEGTANIGDNFFDRNYIAVQNDSFAVIDMRWNWWGDSTGPYHEWDHTEGLGDTILGHGLRFDPWHTDTSFFADVPGIDRPLPEDFALEAFPNPFNSSVHIRLTPSAAEIVRIELFDVLGRNVREIWCGPIAFQKDIIFDGRDLASGSYWIRASATLNWRVLASKRIVLLK